MKLGTAQVILLAELITNANAYSTYEGCPKSKYTDFLFKRLSDSPDITSYILQSMTLGKLYSGSSVFSTDHSSTGSHFP